MDPVCRASNLLIGDATTTTTRTTTQHQDLALANNNNVEEEDEDANAADDDDDDDDDDDTRSSSNSHSPTRMRCLEQPHRIPFSTLCDLFERSIVTSKVALKKRYLQTMFAAFNREHYFSLLRLLLPQVCHLPPSATSRTSSRFGALC
jgi:hypothetical protein